MNHMTAVPVDIHIDPHMGCAGLKTQGIHQMCNQIHASHLMRRHGPGAAADFIHLQYAYVNPEIPLPEVIKISDLVLCMKC